MFADFHGSVGDSFFGANGFIQDQHGIAGQILKQGDNFTEEHLVLIHAGKVTLLVKGLEMAGPLRQGSSASWAESGCGAFRFVSTACQIASLIEPRSPGSWVFPWPPLR